MRGGGVGLEGGVPGGGWVAWGREEGRGVVGNLVENACKWAEREGGVGIASTAGGYQLWVDDDGPGIPESRRQQVLERGSRLDEQVDGHGLGLGIVRDICDAWGGTLSLAQSPLGGLRVTLNLPRKGA